MKKLLLAALLALPIGSKAATVVVSPAACSNSGCSVFSSTVTAPCFSLTGSPGTCISGGGGGSGGGGNVSGSGNANKMAKFITASTIASSNWTESMGNLSSTGSISASSGVFTGYVQASTFNAVGTSYQVNNVSVIDSGRNFSGVGGTFSATVTASNFVGDGSGLTGLSAGSPAGANGSIQFNNSGAFGGDINQLFISSVGYVGIGISSPLTKLHVDGGSENNFILSEASSGGGNVFVGFTAQTPNSSYTSGVDGTTGQLTPATGVSADAWVLRDNLNSKTPFVVQSNAPESSWVFNTVGNLGLSYPSPPVKLSIKETASAAAAVYWESLGAISQYYFQAFDGDGSFRLINNQLSASILTATNDDRLGIGTNTPLEKLHVGGRMMADSGIQASSGSFSGGVEAYGLFLSSTPIPSITCNAGTGVLASRSTNQHGEFVAGAGASSCTITFSTSWPKKPSCFCNDQSAILATRATPTTTTLICDVAITFSGDTIQYGCMGAM